MKIKYYLYNAFIIEEGGTKIAIDPGKNLWMFKPGSLIPKSEWDGITHILLTHGDPDHFDYAIPLAQKSRAKVICGEQLVEDFRSKKITDVYKLEAGDTINLKGVRVKGLKTLHGPLPVKLFGGLFEMNNIKTERTKGGQEVYICGKRVQQIEEAMDVSDHGTIKLFRGLIRLEKDNIGFSRGSVGLNITVGNKTIVNLGDTMLQPEWKNLNPDVLMIPIGGRVIRNTMDEREALEAVRLISPGMVIPVHYNCDFLWKRNINPADDNMFKREVEKMGIECNIMQSGDEIEV